MSAGIYSFGLILIYSPTLISWLFFSDIIALFSFLSALCLCKSSNRSFIAVAITITTKGVYSVGKPSDTVIAGI